jgi:hypothetical protein
MPNHSNIKSARERGLINAETMAAALQDDARALAYTQWKLDGNDGPASPPEGWQAEVTAETLTDEQILRMQDDIAEVTGTNPSYTTIALAHPVGRDRRAQYKRDRDAKRYLAARETCARIWNERYAAIDARREGSK